MKKLNKRLIFSLFALVLSVGLATTTTYAWFTMNDTPSVEGFQMQVTTKDGLYVSLEDGNYKTKINAVDVIQKIKTNTAESGDPVMENLVKLDPLTSTDGITLTKLGGSAGVKNKDFVEFDIYFFSQAPYTVKLDVSGSASQVTSSGEGTVKTLSEIVVPGGTNIAAGASLDAKTANATRISFYNGTTAKTWEPNAGLGYSASTYTTPGVNVAGEYYKQLFGTYPTTGGIDPVVAVRGTLVPADDVILTLSGADRSYKGTLTVRIWLEGTDEDCLSGLIASTLQVALNFAGNSTAL